MVKGWYTYISLHIDSWGDGQSIDRNLYTHCMESLMMGGMTTIHIQCFDNGTYEVYRISRVDCCVKVVLCFSLRNSGSSFRRSYWLQKSSNFVQHSGVVRLMSIMFDRPAWSMIFCTLWGPNIRNKGEGRSKSFRIDYSDLTAMSLEWWHMGHYHKMALIQVSEWQWMFKWSSSRSLPFFGRSQPLLVWAARPPFKNVILSSSVICKACDRPQACPEGQGLSGIIRGRSLTWLHSHKFPSIGTAKCFSMAEQWSDDQAVQMRQKSLPERPGSCQCGCCSSLAVLGAIG